MSEFKTYTVDELLKMEFPPLPVDLALLERLHAEATPEPWKAVMDLGGGKLRYGPADGIQYGGEADFGGFGIDQFNGSSNPAADVRLIAATRNALPGLLKMARELEVLKGGKK